MHGTVGVAPAAFEARMTITPDAHGGNMDTPELRAGVTVYFGVNVDGALFALGDGHARQGHGEVCGVAVEAAMETTVVVELLKGVSTPWPRLESDDVRDERPAPPGRWRTRSASASTTWSPGSRS